MLLNCASCFTIHFKLSYLVKQVIDIGSEKQISELMVLSRVTDEKDCSISDNRILSTIICSISERLQ